MARITHPDHRQREPLERALPPLENGDHMDQPTFHARYEAMPEDFRAELIGGIVYVPSPLKRPHSRAHVLINRWLADYEDATPGVEAHDNATNILGKNSEPQPDACLLIVAPGKGQTRDEASYIVGAPELVIEVASSTASIDLHRKLIDYERAGVREYLVAMLQPPKAIWFAYREGKFEELLPSGDGIIRSETFPGLWLDPAALLRDDRRQVRDVLKQGLASPEHAAFVARLRGA